jgi:hypothetical protein
MMGLFGTAGGAVVVVVTTGGGAVGLGERATEGAAVDAVVGGRAGTVVAGEVEGETRGWVVVVVGREGRELDAETFEAAKPEDATPTTTTNATMLVLKTRPNGDRRRALTVSGVSSGTGIGPRERWPIRLIRRGKAIGELSAFSLVDLRHE